MNLLIIFIAKYLFLLSIIIFLYFLWKMEPGLRNKFLLFSFIAFPLSYISAKFLSHFIYDPRPFVVEHVAPLIRHAPDNGFPSDHMLLTMTIASVVFVYNKRIGILLTVIAVSIGVSRVLAKVHHPWDIIGSAVIAVFASCAAYFILPFVVKYLKRRVTWDMS
ncbi:phosphatase PAP2 family protein [Patescibacteria group bacterium]|nr:phosphatase PAP2 family protein [Patescibacteria group bacterium]